MANRQPFISLTINGFDEILKEIEKAGGSINGAVDSCMRESAKIQKAELVSTMQKKKIDKGLIGRMPEPEIEWDGNVCTARVGYKKGKYDPKNLSDGYKALFLNYGTPRRKKHGHVKARGFIKAAKKKAQPSIKKKQAETLEEILRGLKT